MKIDVIKLQGRWVNTQSSFAIAAMVERARERGHDVHFPPDVFGSAMITHARNLSLKAVRKDSDYVLFVDDDMVPMQGALTRLIGHGTPVVSALCTTRTMPPKIAAKFYDPETEEFSLLEEFDENVLASGPWAIGFGFVLIQRAVLDQVIEFVLSGNDWLALSKKMLDRLRVRSEAREAERARIETRRRALYVNEGIAPVFQLNLHPEVQHEIAEDMHFSRLLHAMEIPVWIDSGCLVGHIGDFPYSPLNLGMKHASEVVL